MNPKRLCMAVSIVILLICSTVIVPAALAQRGRMMRIFPMTLVVEKPASQPDFRDPRAIWLGVREVIYPFRLQDAFTDVPEGDTAWSASWEEARAFRPNFHVLGPHMDDISGIKPGKIVTLKGMYAPLTRTFELTEVLDGGAFPPPQSY